MRQRVTGAGGLFVVLLVSAMVWQSVRNARDDWLQQCALSVSSGMTLAEVQQLIGSKPDHQSSESVLLRDGMLLAGTNSRIRPDEEPQVQTLSVWKGGRFQLTVITGADGLVLGRNHWTPPRSVPILTRLWNTVRSVASRLL
jgi:hypothetical protein